MTKIEEIDSCIFVSELVDMARDYATNGTQEMELETIIEAAYMLGKDSR